MLTETATRVANWFDAATHNPRDTETRLAYAALCVETIEQFDRITESGFRVEFTTHDPYADSGELFDAYENGGIQVFRTEAGSLPVDHPLAAPVGGPGLIMNDIFRAVHDYYGHCQQRNTFSASGEDAAYCTHRELYSVIAHPALAAETRCQNSWFNYGPFRDLVARQRPFADQKAVAAPRWIFSA